MLTVMCPNCRHRFPAPGCCNPGGQGTFVVGRNNRGVENETDGGGILSRGAMRNSEGAFYGGGYLLVPRDYNGAGGGGGGCFINAPTIINGPTIIQQPSILEKIEPMVASSNEAWLKVLASDRKQRQREETVTKDRDGTNDEKASMRREDSISDCHIDTSCELTGGTVTITTPRIQSGGCLIRAKDTDILVQSPRIEIRPKVSLIGGGGCFVKKHHQDLRIEEASPGCSDDDDDVDDDDDESSNDYYENEIAPPSGCQELPGSRFPSASKNHHQRQRQRDPNLMSRNNEFNARNGSVETNKRHSSCCCASGAQHRDDSRLEANNHEYSSRRGSNRQRDEKRESLKKNATVNESSSGPMEIRVNATVQLPPSLAHCTLNITATTGSTSVSNDNSGRIGPARRDNFNGGGLVHLEHDRNEANNERREEAPPTTPLSWLMPCPWGFDNYSMDKDATRLKEIKRLLQTSGWYHEGLSWQQSETLLENASLGRWLVRDSSDSRFVFAVSVQTPRGPTSVRVHYFLGRFRLDAEPRMSLAMPLFECPIKMLQHYVDYSKRIDEHRKEVWVDYSGQLYSQIYLTKPLVKDVQTLSHLARVAVNSYKLNIDYLPPLIKNYLAEYPYSL